MHLQVHAHQLPELPAFLVGLARGRCQLPDRVALAVGDGCNYPLADSLQLTAGFLVGCQQFLAALAKRYLLDVPHNLGRASTILRTPVVIRYTRFAVAAQVGKTPSGGVMLLRAAPDTNEPDRSAITLPGCYRWPPTGPPTAAP